MRLCGRGVARSAGPSGWLVEGASARPQHHAAALGAQRHHAAILRRVERTTRAARHAVRVVVALGAAAGYAIGGEREGRTGTRGVGAVLSAARRHLSRAGRLARTATDRTDAGGVGEAAAIRGFRGQGSGFRIC